MSKKYRTKILRFLKSEDGPTSVEYAVLLALIVGMMVAAITYVGDEVKSVADDNNTAIGDALGGE